MTMKFLIYLSLLSMIHLTTFTDSELLNVRIHYGKADQFNDDELNDPIENGITGIAVVDPDVRKTSFIITIHEERKHFGDLENLRNLKLVDLDKYFILNGSQMIEQPEKIKNFVKIQYKIGDENFIICISPYEEKKLDLLYGTLDKTYLSTRPISIAKTPVNLADSNQHHFQPTTKLKKHGKSKSLPGLTLDALRDGKERFMNAISPRDEEDDSWIPNHITSTEEQTHTKTVQKSGKSMTEGVISTPRPGVENHHP
jgi:hypothetical protein